MMKNKGAPMARSTAHIFDMLDKVFNGRSTRVSREDIPAHFEVRGVDFTKFWKVEVFGIGTYLVAAGHPYAKKQYVVWMPNGDFWYSFGHNITNAVERATAWRLSGDYKEW